MAANFDPFGKLAEVQRWKAEMDLRRQQMAQQEKQNALAMALQQAQLARFNQEQEREGQTSSALREMYGNAEYLDPSNFQQRGGELLSEITRNRPNADVPALYKAMSSLQPEPVDPYKGLTADYATYLRANRLENSPQAYAGYQKAEIDKKKAGASTTNVSVDTGKRESSMVEPVLKELPQLRTQANMSKTAIGRVDKALDIIDKQGNSVLGLSGSVKRAIAPYAAALGMDTNKLDDAQILHSLLKEGAGGLRAQVIGPGPVTNYEQEILQQVSGGTMAAAEGAKRVLEYQREQHQGIIDGYNSQVESVSGFKGYEGATKLYPKVQYTQRKRPETATTGEIKFLGFE